MKQSVLLFVLFNCFYIHYAYSSNLPGPLVYVVTPASKIPQWKDGARTAPFYYSNWMKRMDTPSSSTPITTTEERKTPDLIFAEFESDNSNMKSIRKLLEKENIDLQTTTTMSQPIFVPEEDASSESENDFIQSSTEEPKKVDMTDYFALYNNLYNTGAVYVPNNPSSTVQTPTATTTYTTTTTTTEQPMNNVESVWHIIDNQKHDEYSGKWQETAINSVDKDNDLLVVNNDENDKEISNENESLNDNGIDENFALPGFGTNAGNGGENESRAIRTQSNIRFPYVNLKPFMMKNSKTKNVNNMFNLDSFTEIKNPVRGEAQDNPVASVRQTIDRYNPAQPYLPEYGIGVKSKPKQHGAPPPASIAAPQRPPTKAVANLVPPPPPAPPKLTADDFPTPSTYESFPPYAPKGPGAGSIFSSPGLGSDSSDNDNDGPPSGPPTGTGYRYKPPAPPTDTAPPASPFVPTLPPLSKPFPGYSYNKPPIAQDDSPSAMDMDDKPGFHGYQYSKPMLGFSYDKSPTTQGDSPPAMDTKDKPDFHSYSNPVPAHPPPSEDHQSPGYGYHDAPPPSYHSESDYPDLIFDKPHGIGDMKGGNDMKVNDMGMMPPPPPPGDTKPDSYEPPMNDHGFPHDFPGDFKYAHDFDDHDYHHHHHHTTTTEMPRVNRYSYYYLGKKLYYLPLYFSVYFVIYVGALIIKAVLRHKITYPNSFRPGNDPTASFFSKRSIDSHLTNENLHEITGRVTRAIATAAEKYISDKSKDQ